MDSPTVTPSLVPLPYQAPAIPAYSPPNVRRDVGRTMRGALAVLDRMLPDERANVDGLAAALNLVQQLKRDLSALQRSIEGFLVEAMPARLVTVEGLGTLTRYGGSKRAWDHEAVITGVVRAVLVDEETGQVDASLARLRQLVETISRAAGVTESTQWRTGVIRGLGLDPDALSEKVPGRRTVSLTGAEK